MKILKRRQKYSDDKQPVHLVEKKEWKSGDFFGHITNLHITTFCDKELFVEKGDTYEDFEKKSHAKLLCQECVKIFKMRKRHVEKS